MAVKQNPQSGQVLLITLLVLSVATTIALSVIGRTTLETQSISQTEESTRAFNAAEAGIEVSLKSGLPTSNVTVSGVNYNTQISDFGNSSGIYRMPTNTFKGETETIWLANHNGVVLDESTQVLYPDDIAVCMGSDSSTLPAMVVSVYFKDGLLYKTKYGAYDPVPERRSGTFPYSLANNFTAPSATSNGCGSANMFIISNLLSTLGLNPTPPSVVLLMLRIRPVYNDATIAIDTGTATLPFQGNQIISSGNTTSGLTRKIIVNQQYRTLSSAFDGGVFSQDSFGHP